MADTSTKEKQLDNLIGETDPKIDREAKEKLVSARIGLLLRAPFFGNMATRLELTNADEWMPTAATDGRRFYYNSRFVNMLETKEIEFLFGHEVLHCCYDHIGRGETRDRKLFNIAADYCVNRDLVKHSVGKFITTVDCLYDTKYDGWTAEEIYDELYENADKIDIDELIRKMLDEHLDENQDCNSESEKGKGDGPVKLSKEDLEQIKNEIKEAMMQASQAAGADNTPESVSRMINQLTNPQMDWKDLLRQTLESTIKDDFSWCKPSRRGWHVDAVLPGMTPGQEVDLVVAIDTSGSISTSDLTKFLSEIQGIMDAFTTYRIHVFCFDTDVYNPQIFTSDNLDEIADYQVTGHGGTDFNCVFKYLVKEGIEPQRLVMFTDGYPWNDNWGDSNYCDTLFVIHGNDSIIAPYGVTTHFKE